MCGRYHAVPTNTTSLKRSHWATLRFWPSNSPLNYNVAPQTMQPVIIWDKDFGTRALHMMFGRFVLLFVTVPKEFKLFTINAKAEALMSNKM